MPVAAGRFLVSPVAGPHQAGVITPAVEAEPRRERVPEDVEGSELQPVWRLLPFVWPALGAGKAAGRHPSSGEVVLEVAAVVEAKQVVSGLLEVEAQRPDDILPQLQHPGVFVFGSLDPSRLVVGPDIGRQQVEPLALADPGVEKHPKVKPEFLVDFVGLADDQEGIIRP